MSMGEKEKKRENHKKGNHEQIIIGGIT